MFLVADKEIKAGWEVTVDYGYDFRDDSNKRVRCACRSTRCSGWIGLTASQVKADMDSDPHSFPDLSEDTDVDSLPDDVANMSVDDLIVDDSNPAEKDNRTEHEDQGDDGQEDGAADVLAGDPRVLTYMSRLEQWYKDGAGRSGAGYLGKGNRKEIACVVCEKLFSLLQVALKHLIRCETDVAKEVFRQLRKGGKIEKWSAAYVVEFEKKGCMFDQEKVKMDFEL